MDCHSLVVYRHMKAKTQLPRNKQLWELLKSTLQSSALKTQIAKQKYEYISCHQHKHLSSCEDMDAFGRVYNKVKLSFQRPISAVISALLLNLSINLNSTKPTPDPPLGTCKICARQSVDKQQTTAKQDQTGSSIISDDIRSGCYCQVCSATQIQLFCSQ